MFVSIGGKLTRTNEMVGWAVLPVQNARFPAIRSNDPLIIFDTAHNNMGLSFRHVERKQIEKFGLLLQ